MEQMELETASSYQELLGRISQAYTEGRLRAFQSVNIYMTATYWKIGHDIVEYEQGGKAKAGYGKALLANLSRDLTLLHGKGFSRSNLVYMRLLYLRYPISQKLSEASITASATFGHSASPDNVTCWHIMALQ